MSSVGGAEEVRMGEGGVVVSMSSDGRSDSLWECQPWRGSGPLTQGHARTSGCGWAAIVCAGRDALMKRHDGKGGCGDGEEEERVGGGEKTKKRGS